MEKFLKFNRLKKLSQIKLIYLILMNNSIQQLLMQFHALNQDQSIFYGLMEVLLNSPSRTEHSFKGKIFSYFRMRIDNTKYKLIGKPSVQQYNILAVSYKINAFSKQKVWASS